MLPREMVCRSGCWGTAGRGPASSTPSAIAGRASLDACMEASCGDEGSYGRGEKTFRAQQPGVLDCPDPAKVAGRWRAAGAVISSTVHEWQVWLVAALLLFVAEMLAPGFWLLSVAVGCVLAGGGSLVGAGVLGPGPGLAARALLSPGGRRPFPPPPTPPPPPRRQ